MSRQEFEQDGVRGRPAGAGSFEHFDFDLALGAVRPTAQASQSRQRYELKGSQEGLTFAQGGNPLLDGTGRRDETSELGTAAARLSLFSSPVGRCPVQRQESFIRTVCVSRRARMGAERDATTPSTNVHAEPETIEAPATGESAAPGTS